MHFFHKLHIQRLLILGRIPVSLISLRLHNLFIGLLVAVFNYYLVSISLVVPWKAPFDCSFINRIVLLLKLVASIKLCPRNQGFILSSASLKPVLLIESRLLRVSLTISL